MADRSALKLPHFSAKKNLLWCIWCAVIFFCGLFILFPLIKIFSNASAADWRQVLASPRWREACLNTLFLTACSSILAVATGFVYAYAVTRGDIPLKKIFAAIPLLRIMTPPFVGGLAFILLFGRQGLVTHKMLGLDISLYGFGGLVLAQTLSFFPSAFMILKSAIENIGTEQEMAAFSMGAKRMRVFFTMTLPLCLPHVLSAVLFVGLSVLSDFGNPVLVGGRFRVLPTEVYSQLSGWVNAGTSSCLGIILLVPGIALFLYHRKFSQRKVQQTATIKGRGHSDMQRKPVVVVRVVLTAFCAVISIVSVAQIVVLVWGAFTKIWGVDTTITFSHIMRLPRYATEISNTVIFSFVVALVTPFIAAICAFLSTRTSLPCRQFIDMISTLPAAVPSPLIGLSFVLAFNNFLGVIRFTGTKFIIVLALIIMHLPVCYRIVSASFSQIKQTVDDSAVSLGSSELQVFWNILLPLSAKNIVSAFTFAFIRATGSMGAVIFLISFKTQLVSVAILNLAEQGSWGIASALAVALTLAVFLVLGLVDVFLKFAFWFVSKRWK